VAIAVSTVSDPVQMVKALRSAVEPGLPYGPSLIPLDILIAVTAAARDDEPLTVRQLLDALPHSVTGTRYNLKRLIADGWVERTRAEWDRRIVFLLPTERTVKAFQAMAAAL